MGSHFDGKVVLITGAGKGLGRAYAIWFAERGARVVVNNRVHPGIPSSAQAVANEITQCGGIAVADEHAVNDEAGANAMIEAAYEKFGKLDVQICNAGIADKIPFMETPMARIREVMDVNFWGTLYPVYAALPRMLSAGFGRIVLSTSQAGLFGQKGGVPYCASKAALIGLARGIARDVGETDVRINLVAPAAYTPMSQNTVDARWIEFLSPFKVAPVVGWLSSEACRDSGMIFHAGAGRVRRAKILEGKPAEIRDEDMSACWPALDDMTDAVEARSSFDSGRMLMPELFATVPDRVNKA